jgi:hypothetical protein
MKILAFAHVTFTGTPENGSNKSLHFQSVSNPAWKSKYMKDFSNLHDITLVRGHITVEYVQYKKTDVCSQKYVNSVIDLDRATIYSRDFSKQFFQLLSEFGNATYSSDNDFITISSTFPNGPVRLQYRQKGKSFNGYLDDDGLTGIAFYVDDIQEVANFLIDKDKCLGEFDLSTTIDLQLGLNSMKILLIRWRGITIEFIERKRKSN